uniref:Uncharacterized protein n=1 Tax=Anguilla anguilla TaxID=7936 RepID=A0A0E9SQB3_ANGAN
MCRWNKFYNLQPLKVNSKTKVSGNKPLKASMKETLKVNPIFHSM